MQAKFIVYPLYPDNPIHCENLAIARINAKNVAIKFNAPIAIQKRQWNNESHRFNCNLVCYVDKYGKQMTAQEALM